MVYGFWYNFFSRALLSFFLVYVASLGYHGDFSGISRGKLMVSARAHDENNLENNNSNNMIENNLSEEEEVSVLEKNSDKPGKDNNNFDRDKGNNKGKTLGKYKK